MILGAAAASGAYNWVGVVGGLLGVIGLIGAAVAVLRSSIATNTIKLLQDNNAALHEQNGQQAATISTQAQEIELLKTRVTKQDETIHTLEGRIDAKEELAKLNERLASYHSDVLAAIGRTGA